MRFAVRLLAIFKLLLFFTGILQFHLGWFCQGFGCVVAGWIKQKKSLIAPKMEHSLNRKMVRDTGFEPVIQTTPSQTV
jgi:hypothetical protein